MSAQGVKKYSATYSYYQGISKHVCDRRDTYVNHLKCNFAIILRYKKLKFCFIPVEFESTDKFFKDFS